MNLVLFFALAQICYLAPLSDTTSKFTTHLKHSSFSIFPLHPAENFLCQDQKRSHYSAACVTRKKWIVNCREEPHQSNKSSAKSHRKTDTRASQLFRSGSETAGNQTELFSENVQRLHSHQDRVLPNAESSHGSRLNTGARILILHPIYAGSHEVVLRRLGEELVRRGYSVTQLKWKSDHAPIDERRHASSKFNVERAHKWKVTHNLTTPGDQLHEHDEEFRGTSEDCKFMDIITVSPDNEDLRYPYMRRDGALQPPTRLLWHTERSILNVPTDVFGLIDAHCSTLLGDAELISTLNTTGYTVALVDLIANECSLALARLLGLPVVGYWGFPLQGGEARRVGMSQLPSVVPAMMTEAGFRMNFFERVHNFVFSLLDELLVTYHLSVTDHWIKKLHPYLPSSSRLLSEVDTLMVSVSWHVDYAKHLPPHVHYIGCLTCTKEFFLDQEMLDWVEGSGEAGVIVFSFGLTGFSSSVVPESFRDGALRALAQLPQRIVLHFDPAQLQTLPPNVLARTNIPQQDLLAHPATKLFVSHCGMNSVNEAVYHATPLLCVPNFADQGDIARRVLDRGLGLRLAKEDLTQDTLYEMINRVIQDNKFNESVTRTSQMWQSEESGTDAAVRLILSLHRFGPFKHIQPPGTHLNILQYYCLDVIGFILVMAVGILMILSELLCHLYRLANSQRKKGSDKLD
ncbi:UDP-glucuronosyltransferase 2B33 [Hyalella azteca]|uniref:UDP-glucuronosyltransferase 2B33 n=1 Tax=Hyalella azteca TaxID=294128 RepID=A0A8B7NDI7_HYAAZ|nr:UDP-glucuronosyltransferase 2B33 [Hyalella azteca]